ncbi:MAG: ABC transporter ATP-binding protein [Chloroflexi bacterium]|nr:ABC transporter ATP-binding protein [Chloroflexota bacterium]
MLVLPSLLGVYLSEIFNSVGLYILMGLGLNIAIGLAGLLDLGYVTNFAVGAYIMALLTSSSDFGLAEPISFWFALPICVGAAMLTGFIFALPVLKMRGDYLAIATLGFGEIIRVLARSDALKAYIGGAQGILQIPQAKISGFFVNIFAFILDPINNFLQRFELGILATENGEIVFGNPPQLYYLLILASLLMLFVSRRLNNSRTGRRWMAIREDEDVAAAMGINTINAKVVAFTLSAASGGLAGALFAAKLGSIFPHSFQLLISINVLSLIIVGGIGSIPGVIVGAFALIGVPELLREFAEFRLLLYGVALIVMMLVRPEGLWPSEVRRREMQGDEDTAVPQPTQN